MKRTSRRRWWLTLACCAAGAHPAYAQHAGVDSAATETAGGGPGRFFPIPVVFYQPETGWGFGGALLHTLRLARDARTSQNFLALIYTLKNQYSGSLQSELHTAGERFVLRGELIGSHFPDRFYGIGNDTQADTSEDYTLDQARVALDPRIRLTRGVFLAVSTVYQWTEVKEAVAGGALAADTLPGSDGGTVLGFGLGVVVDTRDHTLGPRRGVYLTASARGQGRSLGSDFGYVRYELDTRGYLTVTAEHVLALQLAVAASTGEPPFFDLARLGGANLFRGSWEGRFRDRQRVAAQAEYRLPVWGPLGAVVFGSAGQVMRGWDDFAFSDLHYAGGGGVRIRLSRADRVNLRVDFAAGPGESGVYFALGEAF